MAPIIDIVSPWMSQHSVERRGTGGIVGHHHPGALRVVEAVVVAVEAVASPVGAKYDGLAVGHLSAPRATRVDGAAVLYMVAVVGPGRGAGDRLGPAINRRNSCRRQLRRLVSGRSY